MKKSKLLQWWCSAIFMLLYGLITTFAQNNFPQRIISLGPTITEDLYLLGVEDRIVGNTIYCKRPASIQKIGTVIAVNLEKIISLKPDLVIATSLTDPKTIEKLKDLRIEVAMFPQPGSFSALCEDFLKLGRVVGKEKEAAEVVAQAQKRVILIQDKVKDLAKPRVFIQIGARPLCTVTRDSFVNDFIELAGGVNVAGAARSGLYSREKVLQDNPEVIIIATMGLVGEEEKRVWQKFKTLKAVQNNQIYSIDSYKVCSPTPVSFTATLEEMIKLIHQ